MMNLSAQLIIVVVLSLAIGNGNPRSLTFWYTRKDLNCIIYSNQTDERSFNIEVYPFWSLIKNEYCKSQNGTVIKIEETKKNENECNQHDLRTLEIYSGYKIYLLQNKI